MSDNRPFGGLLPRLHLAQPVLTFLAAGNAHDAVGTAHDNGMASVQKGDKEVSMGESKLLESGGFVVTTERFVYGSEVVRLDDIKGDARRL